MEKDKRQGWKMEMEDGKWTGKGLTQVKFYHIIPLLSFIALMSYVKYLNIVYVVLFETIMVMEIYLA